MRPVCMMCSNLEHIIIRPVCVMYSGLKHYVFMTCHRSDLFQQGIRPDMTVMVDWAYG